MRLYAISLASVNELSIFFCGGGLEVDGFVPCTLDKHIPAKMKQKYGNGTTSMGSEARPEKPSSFASVWCWVFSMQRVPRPAWRQGPGQQVLGGPPPAGQGLAANGVPRVRLYRGSGRWSPAPRRLPLPGRGLWPLRGVCRPAQTLVSGRQFPEAVLSSP